MFPILVDLKAANVALAGNGEAALRRLAQLDAEAARVTVYAPSPSETLVQAARGRLNRWLPDIAGIGSARLLFITDLAKDDAASLADLARKAGVLVNTEDGVPLSDFHVPAIVRRGDLTLTVSTGGTSPALARILKRRLEDEFGEHWGARLDEIALWRKAWRAEGLKPSEITARTETELTERGWLS